MLLILHHSLVNLSCCKENQEVLSSEQVQYLAFALQTAACAIEEAGLIRHQSEMATVPYEIHLMEKEAPQLLFGYHGLSKICQAAQNPAENRFRPVSQIKESTVWRAKHNFMNTCLTYQNYLKTTNHTLAANHTQYYKLAALFWPVMADCCNTGKQPTSRQLKNIVQIVQ